MVSCRTVYGSIPVYKNPVWPAHNVCNKAWTHLGVIVTSYCALSLTTQKATRCVRALNYYIRYNIKKWQYILLHMKEVQ